MSDEEKEAIDKIEYYNNLRAVDLSLYYLDMQIATKTLLNLIEKQSKEIEELKNADLTTVYLNGVYDGEKKVKDKIKAKIEEYQNKIDKMYTKKLWNEPIDTINKNRYVNYVNILQSLLEKE